MAKKMNLSIKMVKDRANMAKDCNVLIVSQIQHI